MISVDYVGNAETVEPLVLAMRQILGDFDTHRQQVVDTSENKSWQWKSGVILFPEALCPSCNGVMRSNRIWWVDERAQRVIQAVQPEADKLKKITSLIHPHVDGPSGGSVCVGNAKSTTEALFLGLGMGSPYWAASSDWYRKAFDHECSSSTRRRSREHLSESIKLGEAKAVPPPPPAPEVQVTIAEIRRATRRELQSRIRERVSTVVEPEAPLFNGAMAGNSNNRGISVNDRPTGLNLDDLERH